MTLIIRPARWIRFDFDVATMDGVAEVAEDRGVKIERVNPDGPGGGNPQVFASAADLQVAKEFLAEVYGVDRKNPEQMELYVDPILARIS